MIWFICVWGDTIELTMIFYQIGFCLCLSLLLISAIYILLRELNSLTSFIREIEVIKEEEINLNGNSCHLQKLFNF